MSKLNRSQRAWKAVLVSASLTWLASVEPLAAQVTGGSLRPYWHIFIAYAVAWIMVVAWLIHIARRLRRVTEDAR